MKVIGAEQLRYLRVIAKSAGFSKSRLFESLHYPNYRWRLYIYRLKRLEQLGLITIQQKKRGEYIYPTTKGMEVLKLADEGKIKVISPKMWEPPSVFKMPNEIYDKLEKDGKITNSVDTYCLAEVGEKEYLIYDEGSDFFVFIDLNDMTFVLYDGASDPFDSPYKLYAIYKYIVKGDRRLIPRHKVELKWLKESWESYMNLIIQIVSYLGRKDLLTALVFASP